ncbi:hypothetical protein B296_00045154 [Ensete ventricosum]|uniref:Uncharacterized protein n=1 Tax=Ensete ventricosum TaxID=4639 RepID=A0A426YNX7_ENSVE|nr:hypothetical protein B296_00045154 [Ensete ventricosum]
MYAIRARRKTVTEKDFLDAVNKVIKGYQKFSATPKYMEQLSLRLCMSNDHELLHERQLWGKGGSQAWGSFARVEVVRFRISSDNSKPSHEGPIARDA